MNYFPKRSQSLFYVPTQKPCTALGGCIGSNLVTARFDNGMILSVRMTDLVPNEIVECKLCAGEAKPDEDGVCKKCRTTICPICGTCNCSHETVTEELSV
ncbi:MAG: hypothetical protein AB1341_09390 [Bacillota bacterium]